MIKKSDDSLKDVMCVYKIVNDENGKVYIGSTVNLKQRLNNHYKKLKENIHTNSELQKEWNIYREENFSFEIIELIDDKSKLPITEAHYINEYKTLNGVYNKSNPTEEFWQRRYDKKSKKSLADKAGNLKKNYIYGWLDAKFTHAILRVKEILEQEAYYEKSKIDDFIIKHVDNAEIESDERLNDLLNQWYQNNNIQIVSFPNYKKEFRQLFNITIEDEKDVLVNRQTISLIRKKRVENLQSLKDMRNTKIEQPYQNDTLDELHIKLGQDFKYLFDALDEKLAQGESISYSKVSSFIYEKIIKDIDIELEDFNNRLKKFLYAKDGIKISIFDFSKSSYYGETMSNFNITKREIRILSREKGKEIMHYNKNLKQSGGI